MPTLLKSRSPEGSRGAPAHVGHPRNALYSEHPSKPTSLQPRRISRHTENFSAPFRVRPGRTTCDIMQSSVCGGMRDCVGIGGSSTSCNLNATGGVNMCKARWW